MWPHLPAVALGRARRLRLRGTCGARCAARGRAARAGLRRAIALRSSRATCRPTSRRCSRAGGRGWSRCRSTQAAPEGARVRARGQRRAVGIRREAWHAAIARRRTSSPRSSASSSSAARTSERCVASAARRARAVDRDDPAWLFYTSGTTGRPKGVVITHGNLLAMAQAFLSDVEAVAPGDALLHPAPLSHGSGLYLVPHVARGAVNVVPESGGFDADEIVALLDARTARCSSRRRRW